MPQGRHRGGPVERPRPLAFTRRLPRDARLSLAAVGVATAVVGATTAVATFGPNARPAAATQALTLAVEPAGATAAAHAIRAGAESRAEERLSRGRIRSTLATTVGTAISGTGPGRAPAAAAGDSTLGAIPAIAGISNAPCPISSSIEVHLTANARAVYRAVCAAFPGTVSSFGGYRAGSPGDHGTGRAVDIMVSGDPGLAIARFVQAHAAALHVTYVIYQQKIWLAGDPVSHWKAMADRGSRTANHYDHVHVSVS